MQLSEFENVFRDGHVVDVDFSTWDRSIGFVVVAVDGLGGSDSRAPVYAVDFEGVSRLEFLFNHLDIRLNDGDHVQWNVYRTKVKEVEGAWEVELSANPQMPVTRIRCQNINFRRLGIQELDKAFPKWNRPGAPMIRQSVERYLGSLARRRRS